MGIMGWSRADLMTRYQHLTQEVRRDIADRLGALLREPPEDRTTQPRPRLRPEPRPDTQMRN
jgi:integrase